MIVYAMRFVGRACRLKGLHPDLRGSIDDTYGKTSRESRCRRTKERLQRVRTQSLACSAPSPVEGHADGWPLQRMKVTQKAGCDGMIMSVHVVEISEHQLVLAMSNNELTGAVSIGCQRS